MRCLMVFLEKLHWVDCLLIAAVILAPLGGLSARLAGWVSRLWLADWIFVAAVALCLLGVWWAWLTASLVLGVLFVLLCGLIGVLYSEYIHAR